MCRKVRLETGTHICSCLLQSLESGKKTKKCLAMIFAKTAFLVQEYPKGSEEAAELFRFFAATQVEADLLQRHPPVRGRRKRGGKERNVL